MGLFSKNNSSADILNICAPLIQSGNLTELKNHLSSLKHFPSWKGKETHSPLHLAAKYNQGEICKFLLNEGISPNITEPFSLKTPLHLAAYFGSLETAKILQQFGADLKATDYIGCSPIHYGAMGEQKDLLLFFIENRIKLSIQSIFGNILDILIRKKNLQLVDFFSSIGGVECVDNYYIQPKQPFVNLYSWTPFDSAGAIGQEKIFEMLLKKFPCVPAIKKEKRTYALTESGPSSADLALLEGNPFIKKMLHIEQDTEEYRKVFMERNWYETDFPRRKNLCDAIRYRDMRKVEELISKQGIEIVFERTEKKDCPSLENPNALDFAVYLYSLPFFELLIEKKVEIPTNEFLIHERFTEIFFNWALMPVHPFGEAYFKRID